MRLNVCRMKKHMLRTAIAGVGKLLERGRDTHRAHAMVWPVVSKPPVKKTPISAAMRSSGSGCPV